MLTAPIGRQQLRPACTIKVNTGVLSANVAAQFGSSSLYCGGSAGGPCIAYNVPQIGTGQFTIEMWVYITGAFGALTSFVEQPQRGASLGLSTTGRLVFTQSFVAVAITDSVAMPRNTWTNIAVCRSAANTLYLFKNGTLAGSVANYTTNLTQTTYSGNYIGSSVTNGAYTGYIDELRLSDICRYTANYTPSTGTFVDDVNTTLLCHFDNLSIGTKSITDDNT